MILVDTTIWIDYFNGRVTPETTTLDKLLGMDEVIMGDIILAEVLQGFRSDQDFETARQALMSFSQVSILNPDLAVRCARNYRQLRKAGITVRKTLDCFIATYCIENNIELLHCDRDFNPFEQHLGLQVIHPSP
jgi:predicted nucleic acid-binding protein